MRDVSAGTSGFFGAFGFAFKHGLWWLFLVPFVFWFALAALMLWVDQAVVDHVQAWAEQYFHVAVSATEREGWAGIWDDVKAFFSKSSGVIVAVVLHLSMLYLLSLIGKYVVLAVLSPVLAYASERTEEILTGQQFPFRLGLFIKEVLRGVLMALRNGFLELSLNAAVWIATLFVPVLAPVSALFLFGVSCWFYGFSMFDYIHERHRLGIRGSVAHARSRTWLVLTNGLWFNLLMKVPLVGVSLAPLAASIGAVIAAHEGRYQQASTSQEAVELK